MRLSVIDPSLLSIRNCRYTNEDPDKSVIDPGLLSIRNVIGIWVICAGCMIGSTEDLPPAAWPLAADEVHAIIARYNS